jgi:FkbH-like protein/thioester reductase-like protein
VRRLGLGERLSSIDDRILAAVAALPTGVALDLRRVDEDYHVPRVWDEERDRLGHLPYTQPAYSALGAALSRRIEGLRFPPAKVIVLDCDNTLWSGVAGDVGPEGVELGEPHLALQRFMVAQAEAGAVLCLASKNDEQTVRDVFDAHPEQPLRREHITAHRINWLPKSENLLSLAAELSLGLDSFMFIDDSPMEVAEVREALPSVLAVLLPPPARISGFLTHHWAFDRGVVTDEDRRRTQLYADHRAREATRGASAGFDDFLSRLELVVELTPPSDDEWERVAQLTKRSNQFNANKIERGVAEITRLCQDPSRLTLRVRVADRFGDYGLVGLLSAVAAEDRLVCDTYLLSCRVLGRRVEHRMISALAEHARALGVPSVEIRLTRAARNAPVLRFLGGLGEPRPWDEAGQSALVLDVATLDDALSRATDEAPPAPEPDVVAIPSARALAAEGFAQIANLGPSTESLRASIDSTSRVHRPALSTPYVTPRTSWEKKIAAIWRNVLGMDRVGANDSWFELGGDSLSAAEALARMWDVGVPGSISLQTIAEPTVASMARAIEDVAAGRRPSLLADTFNLADEGELAPDIRHEGYDVSTYAEPIRKALITGATGYLGAFVMAELLRQTDAEVICLVRASTVEEGRRRIIANLRRYEVWQPEHAERVDVVLGDLVEPRFGLSEEAFRGLAERIDTIFHAAAWVNFVYPYGRLAPTNVHSTETVLRLAIAAIPKPIAVHFVSTLGVIMSTGYGRDKLVHETDPLLYADDLLNGYEQSKYASDKMVWTAFKERGIPGAIYRPGMVGGLINGTYYKLDEFLPQFLKGCIQLKCWPLVDSTWEVVPVDFVSQAIVHIARKPECLNQAYFTLHPKPRQVSEYIDWHRRFGYDVRGLPWDTWKRELLSLGTERLRKNALFSFVDFIRALSEEQIYFPPTERTRFEAAIADMPFELPDQLELLERYTKYFIQASYYENLPSGPRSLKPSEAGLMQTEAVAPVDNALQFSTDKVDFSEAYYVLWNNPQAGLSMVVRYVLHNGVLEEHRMAEVWGGFLDRNHPDRQITLRQRYPIGRAYIHNRPDLRMELGPSGFSDDRIWGVVAAEEGEVRWDLRLDRSRAVTINRIPEADQYSLLPHFQSNGVRHHLSGLVTVNGHSYPVEGQLASDGHYWNTRHMRGWAWAHCAAFDGDPDLVVEAIGTRFNDHDQTSTWVTILWRGQRVTSSLVDSIYHNREQDAGLNAWGFMVERGDLRFICRVRAASEDMNLLVHPLPDDEYLYTHICYGADMELDILRKEGGRWWKVDSRVARGTAAFEVTRKRRNPEVRREFRVVKVR